MGEAKVREAMMKAAQEEEAKHLEELRKLLATPLTKEEAAKALADADVNQAQILVARQKFVAKQDAHRLGIAEAQRGIDQCDEELAGIALSRNIVFRRSLNTTAEQKPAMGEPVKTV